MMINVLVAFHILLLVITLHSRLLVPPTALNIEHCVAPVLPVQMSEHFNNFWILLLSEILGYEDSGSNIMVHVNSEFPILASSMSTQAACSSVFPVLAYANCFLISLSDTFTLYPSNHSDTFFCFSQEDAISWHFCLHSGHSLVFALLLRLLLMSLVSPLLPFFGQSFLTCPGCLHMKHFCSPLVLAITAGLHVHHIQACASNTFF